MAADCMTRACALAIATAACVGFPGALAYAIVRLAAARRFGATFALAVVLVFWVTISAAYYPRVCADIVPWSALARCLRWRRARGAAAAVVAASGSSVLLPLSAVVAERRGRHGGTEALPREPHAPPLLLPAVRGGGLRVAADDDTLAPPYGPRRNGALQPLFVARMGALPREQTAAARRGGALAAADGGEPAAAKRCAVCLCDVEEGETAAWLPACLHMFHHHCIDQWLHKHGHSTCPICRCDAFFAAPLPEQTGV